MTDKISRDTLEVMQDKIMRAAIYLRVSDPKQEKEGTSLVSQEELTRKYCQEQGYKLDDRHVYIDVHTGTEYRERPQLTVMRQAASRGEFDVLVMYSLDRFARKRIHQEIVREELQYHCVKTVTLKKDEHADDDSPIGEIVRAVYGFMAEEERNKIVERTQLGLLTRVKSGKLLPGSRRLYGYQYADPERKQKTRYVIDPYEGPIVQRIYQMAVSGMSLRAIGHQLLNEGIPTPSGKDNLAGWSSQTVRNILMNQFYIGKGAAYKTTEEVRKVRTEEGIVKKRRNVHLSEDKHVKLPDGVVPALVDEATFEAVQKQLQLNKETATRNNKNPEIGLLRCGLIKCRCGHNMAVDNNRGGRQRRRTPAARYRCPRARQGNQKCDNGAGIRVEIIDDAAWLGAVEIIHNPTLVIEKIQGWRQEDPTQLDNQSVKNKLSSITEELKGYSESLGMAENKMVRGLIVQQMERLAQEQEELEMISRDIHVEQIVWGQLQKELDEFEQWCTDIREKLDDPNYTISIEEKRKACRKLGIKALLWRENGEVKYDITSTPPDIVSRSPPILCSPTWGSR